MKKHSEKSKDNDSLLRAIYKNDDGEYVLSCNFCERQLYKTGCKLMNSKNVCCNDSSYGKFVKALSFHYVKKCKIIKKLQKRIKTNDWRNLKFDEKKFIRPLVIKQLAISQDPYAEMFGAYLHVAKNGDVICDDRTYSERFTYIGSSCSNRRYPIYDKNYNHKAVGLFDEEDDVLLPFFYSKSAIDIRRAEATFLIFGKQFPLLVNKDWEIQVLVEMTVEELKDVTDSIFNTVHLLWLKYAKSIGLEKVTANIKEKRRQELKKLEQLERYYSSCQEAIKDIFNDEDEDI